MDISAEIIIREATDTDREAIAGVLLEAYSEYSAGAIGLRSGREV
jgi:hypothetical protein